MLNTVYQLVHPRRFEIAFDDITMDQEHILVRPTHLSICNADERYYQGKRSEDILRQKLPMALIHEGIGRVVYDPTGTFQVGEKVVMIPNTPFEEDEVVAENYLRSSKFRGSSMNGLMQEYVETTADRLCYQATSRFDRTAHARRETIGVWGDGNMGYITALLLKMRFPQCRVYAFGVVESKLSDFSFVDGTYLVSDVPKDLRVDHAFECVGGNAAGQVINQIIDYIKIFRGLWNCTGKSRSFRNIWKS